MFVASKGEETQTSTIIATSSVALHIPAIAKIFRMVANLLAKSWATLFSTLSVASS